MKVLLAIDIQDGMLTHDPARRAAEQCLTLAKSDAYHEIWGTRFVNPGPAGPFLRELGWSKMRAGDPGTDLWDPLAVCLHRVFEKHTYGLPAPLVRELTQRRPDQVDLVGFETDACVLAAAFQLFDQGMSIRILEDACGTAAGTQAHNAALRLARRQFGEENVITIGD